MGQLVIEIPQNVKRFYEVKDVGFGERLLQDLNEMEAKPTKIPAVIPPRRNSLKEDGDAVLGIWSDNEEEAFEIARRIREQNRKVT